MRFRVSPFFAFIGFFCPLFCLPFGFLIISVPSEKEPWMIAVIVIMLFILPILVGFHFLYFSLDLIVITDEAIERYHFGRLKKRILWNDVKTAFVTPKNESIGWIYISDTDFKYNYWTADFSFYGKKIIFMKYNKLAFDEINKHLIRKIQM